MQFYKYDIFYNLGIIRPTLKTDTRNWLAFIFRYSAITIVNVNGDKNTVVRNKKKKKYRYYSNASTISFEFKLRNDVMTNEYIIIVYIILRNYLFICTPDPKIIYLLSLVYSADLPRSIVQYIYTYSFYSSNIKLNILYIFTSNINKWILHL